MESARRIGWEVCKTTHYAQFQCCDRCGSNEYCAGKRKEKLLCFSCFMTHASV